MGKRYDDEPCEVMMTVHDNLFLEVAEEDLLLEEYFASERAIPTPLELAIFMRQMRSDPAFIEKDTLLSFLSKLQAGEILPTTDSLEPAVVVPAVSTVNSDKPAPKGTAEYIALVKSSAPDASDTLRLDYAQQELTEAQILRQEVTRKLPPVPAPPAPKVRE